jgi:hypothetical protein
MAAIRSATGDVRTSTMRAVSAGIRLNRSRVRPCGSYPSRSRFTRLVAKLALAVGRSRNRATRSRTLSDTMASTAQSPFSPMSYTHACGSHWFGAGFGPCRATCRVMAAQMRSMFTKVVMGLAKPLRRGT